MKRFAWRLIRRDLTLATRPPISEPLPDNALRQFLRALHIVCAKCYAI
jgi:hypothetical protein